MPKYKTKTADGKKELDHLLNRYSENGWSVFKIDKEPIIRNVGKFPIYLGDKFTVIFSKNP